MRRNARRSAGTLRVLNTVRATCLYHSYAGPAVARHTHVHKHSVAQPRKAAPVSRSSAEPHPPHAGRSGSDQRNTETA